jgi:hypothetical protein
MPAISSAPREVGRVAWCEGCEEMNRAHGAPKRWREATTDDRSGIARISSGRPRAEDRPHGGWSRAVRRHIVTFGFIPYYPLWALIIIALDVAVVWAVAAHGRDAF